MYGEKMKGLSVLSSLNNRAKYFIHKLWIAILSSIFSIFVLGQGYAIGGPIVTPDDARSHGLESLHTIVESEGVPLPDNLDEILADQSMATKLGKALFNEMLVGSDGIQACATCHFSAGADPRSKNQLNPGLLRIKNSREDDTKGFHNAGADPDTLFETITITPSTVGPNALLYRGDYPFIRDIGNGDNVEEINGVLSPVYPNVHDVTSSQGIMNTLMVSTNKVDNEDEGIIFPDPIFNVGDVNARRVEPRNTPTVINAVFNFHNFVDGRANNRCNGRDPFGHTSLSPPNTDIFEGPGSSGTGPTIFVDNGTGISKERINLRNASLCSQALGPPLSHFEMSFGNGADNARQFTDIAHKLLDRRALSTQKVHYKDSLLADLRYVHPYSYYKSKGLTMTYTEMIQAAFKSRFWDSSDQVEYEGKLRSLIEANFSFFYGVSVMLYQATLIADRTPFDKWLEGDGSFVRGFDERQLRGLNIFTNEGNCINCHSGPELTAASVSNAQRENNLIETMLMRDRKAALYDNGFYNIGVTPTTDDPGRGGVGPDTKPFSSSRQFAFQALGIDPMGFEIAGDPIRDLKCDPDDSNTDGDASTCDDRILGFIDEDFGLGFFPVCKDGNNDGLCSSNSDNDTLLLKRVAADGAFKTPGLRNVHLTAPYMHNGSFATLREVVQFYNRGGNFCRTNKADLDPDIRGLGLSAEQEKDLVAFLISLTDRRVSRRKAPFDGPSLRIPIGQKGDEFYMADFELDGQGEDRILKLPAVGKRGGDRTPKFLGRTNQFFANKVKGGVCSPDIEP